MLLLDLRTDMAFILESERAHACLFISVFRDIGCVQAAFVITIGQCVFSWPVASTICKTSRRPSLVLKFAEKSFQKSTLL